MTFTSFELHAARLLSAHRWAALATLGRGWPICLDGSYAPEPDPGSLVQFLSSLSERTRNLINERRVSLVISETDPVTAIRRHWPVSVSRGRPRWSRTSPRAGLAPVYGSHAGRRVAAPPRRFLAVQGRRR